MTKIADIDRIYILKIKREKINADISKNVYRKCNQNYNTIPKAKQPRSTNTRHRQHTNRLRQKSTWAEQKNGVIN